MGMNSINTSPTVGTSPYYCGAQSTTPSYRTDDAIVQLKIDINAVVAGDEFLVKGLEKIDGTNVRTIYEATILPQSNKGWVSPMFMLRVGWDWSIEKVTGTDRSLPYDLIYVT